MNTNLPLHRSLLTVSVLAGFAVAQQPTATTAAAQSTAALASTGYDRTPIHTAAADFGVGHGIWGAGPNYKVSFHDGATFVPYLGSAYPRTQSLRWITTSARIGALELRTKTPALRYDAFRAEYDLGGLIEAWDLRHDGVEQTFVIARRPASGGDLVIEGSIATALHARAGTAANTLQFVDDAGTPIVGFGAPTAIDAAGRKFAMTTHYQNGTIALALDQVALEQVAWPLTVDPLIGSLYSTSGAELGAVDVQRDSVGDHNVWLASERWVSATDADLYVRRIEDDGTGSVQVYTDISASWSTTGPSLGLHSAAARMVVAFARYDSGTGNRRVRVHEHARADLTLQAALIFIDSGNNNTWRPDVGNDLAIGAPHSLPLVFQREGIGAFGASSTSDIYGCIVDLAANTHGPLFAIGEDAHEDHERPAIGMVTTTSQAWPVAWQVIGNDAASMHVEWDVLLGRVDRNGVAAGQATFNVGNTLHEMGPQICGTGVDIWVAYTSSSVNQVGARPTTTTGVSVFTRRYAWSNGSFVLSSPANLIEAAPDARILLAGIDRDRTTQSHAMLQYRSTVTNNVYWTLLGYRGAEVSEGTVWDAAAGEFAISGAVAYDSSQDRFLLGYGKNQAIAISQIDTWAHPTAFPPTFGGIGCSTGQLSWVGTQLIGDNAGLRLQNIPAGSLCTVLAGLGTTNTVFFGTPPIQNGCWLLVPNTGALSLGFFPIALGPTAQWAFPLPESLPAMMVYFQGVHFDATNTEVLLTQRMSVPLVK